MKYDFMKNHRSTFRIGKMADVLSVTRSGYYSWLKRPKSKTQIANEQLLDKIKKIFKDNYERYGSRRVCFELRLRGIICNHKRVARLMKQEDLKSKRYKKFKVTTNSKHSLPIAPNLLNKDFIVQRPNQVWVSDITYVWTRQGWLYLCVILDLFARQVVGWAMNDRVNKELVLTALRQAIVRRSPGFDLIFHSDRGSQFASLAVQKLLKEHKFRKYEQKR